MIICGTGDTLATVEKLERIRINSQRVGSAALHLPVGFDIDFGVDNARGWLLLQRPSMTFPKPWVRQVVLRGNGGVELVQGFDCASDNLEEVVAAGTQGYYRHRELTERTYFEETNRAMPMVAHLLGDITLTDIHMALQDFAVREKLVCNMIYS